MMILSFEKLFFETGLYWIKGENGSGKSTLFKSLAGIIPCSGDIVFDDKVSLRNNPVEYRRRINYGEAEPLYPGFLTGADLFNFIGTAKGSDHVQREFYKKIFGIEEYFHKPCETYSSGMLKRLSLALSFLGRPRIIILDEPLITLDTGARDVLAEQIRESVTKHNTLFILSSHQSMDPVDFPVSRTYVISNKTIVED